MAERNIRINISDDEWNHFASMCGKHSITISDLIENFISDLTDGVNSNGSDEIDLIWNWFERCWFGSFPEHTMLRYMLDHGYDPEDYMNTIDRIVIANEEKKMRTKTKILDELISEWKEELQEIWIDWNEELQNVEYIGKEPNIQEEVKLIKKWVREREGL